MMWSGFMRFCLWEKSCCIYTYGTMYGHPHSSRFQFACMKLSMLTLSLLPIAVGVCDATVTSLVMVIPLPFGSCLRVGDNGRRDKLLSTDGTSLCLPFISCRAYAGVSSDLEPPEPPESPLVLRKYGPLDPNVRVPYA